MAAPADQEVEVGAAVGLEDVVDVEALPAAWWGDVGGRGGFGRGPAGQLRGGDVEPETPAGDVQLERTPRSSSRVGRGMLPTSGMPG